MMNISRRLFGTTVSLGVASLALPSAKPSIHTPPFAVLVSGGRLSQDSLKKLEAFISAHHREDNFHRVLVLDGEPGMTVALRELRQEAFDILNSPA